MLLHVIMTLSLRNVSEARSTISRQSRLSRRHCASCINSLPLVPHICVGELGQRWFR